MKWEDGNEWWLDVIQNYMVPWFSYGRPVVTISSGELEYHVGRDSRERG